MQYIGHSIDILFFKNSENRLDLWKTLWHYYWCHKIEIVRVKNSMLVAIKISSKKLAKS